MERASKLHPGLRLSGDVLSAGDLACAAWPQAVGQRIAAHTRACRMVAHAPHRRGGRLHLAAPVVRADGLTSPSTTEKEFRPRLVEDLEFRIVPRRASRSARRRRFPPSSRTRPTVSQTRSCRGIYKASRKKALA